VDGGRGCLLHRRAHPDLRDDEALQAVALELLEDHLGHCVAHAIEAGGPDATDKAREALAAIERLVKS
jgi:hypothetical protein